MRSLEKDQFDRHCERLAWKAFSMGVLVGAITLSALILSVA